MSQKTPSQEHMNRRLKVLASRDQSWAEADTALDHVRAAREAWPQLATALEGINPEARILTDVISYALDLTCAEIATRRATKLDEEIYGLANPIS
jgi:hypothetical protein